MNQKINRLYYVEIFLLLGFFIVLTYILSRSFVTSRLLSNEAEDLTNAVLIAENLAELYKGSEDTEAFLDLLHEEAGVTVKEDGETTEIILFYNKDRERDPMGPYEVSVRCDSSESSERGISEAEIAVYNEGKENTIYALSVGRLSREVPYE